MPAFKIHIHDRLCITMYVNYNILQIKIGSTMRQIYNLFNSGQFARIEDINILQEYDVSFWT